MPTPDPIFPHGRVVIYVTRDVAFNLKKMNKVTENVLSRLGCEGCHSGRILDFRQIEQYATNPTTLEIQELAGLAAQF